MKPVEEALRDSGLSKSEIDEVILVGGSTRIPIIQEEVLKNIEDKVLNQDQNTPI